MSWAHAPSRNRILHEAVQVETIDAGGDYRPGAAMAAPGRLAAQGASGQFSVPKLGPLVHNRIVDTCQASTFGF